MGLRGPKSEKHLNVVRVAPERPKPPKGMGKRAKKTWKNIVDSLPPGFFRVGALPLLRAYCEAESVHYDAMLLIEKSSILIKTREGNFVKNPAVSIQSAKSNEMASLASKLRLSPSSYRDRDAAGKDGREQPKSKRAGLMFGDR